MLPIYLLLPPVALSQHSSHSVEAAPTVNLATLFQHTTSRNHKVISQAVDFVVAMQTAPTCSRMAASHLMNECKLLEHAPDFARSRPEAYLDNVKTEYAAKLAVCELLSAQPSNPVPPPHCGVLVPSASACGRGGGWWYSRPETTAVDKQCYPEFKDYQYTQCLRTLQSSPQYWTSFSNARQNAVVMCQASRDALERESHLETFKNLTEVMGAVSEAMKASTETYETMVQDQKAFVNEARDAQVRLREDIRTVHETAVTNMGTLNTEFSNFMETSTRQLIVALGKDQSNEIARIRGEMQAFSGDLVTESSQIMNQFNSQLRAHHEYALTTLRVNHEAQLGSYTILAGKMDDIHDSAARANAASNSSLHTVTTIEQRLSNLANQADHIAEGFAQFSTIPILLASVIRGLMAVAGTLFLFGLLCKLNLKLAIYVAGACSTAYLFYKCGIYVWISSIQPHISKLQDTPLSSTFANLPLTHKGIAVVMLVWTAAYPVSCVNAYMSSAINRHISSYWIQQHSNEGGMGFLPSVEVPCFDASKLDSPCYDIDTLPSHVKLQAR